VPGSGGKTYALMCGYMNSNLNRSKGKTKFGAKAAVPFKTVAIFYFFFRIA
jgi:hypothetical protein